MKNQQKIPLKSDLASENIEHSLIKLKTEKNGKIELIGEGK